MPASGVAKSILKKTFPHLMRWQSSRRWLWKAYWVSGEWELRELHKYTSKDAVSIDIGGNVGEYSYHLSRLSKRVVAFEPNPEYVQRIKSLNIRNLEIHAVALSSQSGDALLRIPMTEYREDMGMASLETEAVSDAQLSRTLKVELKTLDSYGFENIRFMKIDVEGHEEGVIAGALETIRRNKPVMLVEIEERHNKGGAVRISEKLAGLGYKTYYFENGARRPFEAFDLETHQNAANLDERVISNRRAVPYINNFLFVPGA